MPTIRDMMDVVARYGVTCRPQPLPSRYHQMEHGECFANAYELVRLDTSLTYFEGVPLYDKPGAGWHHAWAVDADDNVIDPTWSYDPARVYRGVPIRRAFLLRWRKSDHLSVLDSLCDDPTLLERYDTAVRLLDIGRIIPDPAGWPPPAN